MTLIELLVSLFIVAVMTVVAIPLFSSYQKRNTLDSDAQSIAQFFSYARAVNSNPDVMTRLNAAGESYFEINIKNANNGKIITLYPKSDPSYVMDKFYLNSAEQLTINGSDLSDFTVSVRGKPPKESITCSHNIDCSTLTIKVYLANNQLIYRNIVVKNSQQNQLFSVTVE